MLLSALPHSLVLLLIVSAPSLASASTKKSSLLKRASHFATRQTTSLARDLRVAFGGVLPRSTASGSVPGVIYCKSGAGAFTGSASSSSGNGSASGNGSGGTGGNSANTTASSVLGSSATKKGSSPTGTGTAAGATTTASSAWHLTQSYEGSSFFDGFTFWDTSDPTHGTVQYLSRADGESANLVSTDASTGNAIMRVETTPTVATARKSIRITTNFAFTGGLVIMDAVHMPTGCGTWPAFWSNGPNWPTGGEIDIVEGVNDYTNNQATIHTAPGCALPTDDPAQLGASAAAVTGGTDCAAATSGNAGCGMQSKSSVSLGEGFNSAGGGVYAMQWDSTGISVFFFGRGAIPGDITAQAPQPKSWGLPMAHWPASDCNPWKYFYEHVAIFDTTLCGDWAGSVWTGSGTPGQEQSCATRTGFSTCEAFVLASGGSFAQAYWEVKSLKFYNTTAPL
ncbi:concanavalin A-like lectin/glucanase domain-containing protein [Mycena alexandri]|uniref:Concanavalin A-like lectin/glucanase domain-containing protein n=1 Tax=Mycena alexandri TaxID=1745969 RepID=A0AAD6S7I3_9AGAR|nr:concanavalin A-like lectin/glucanase domain-containing protein [Mycena alexandri]